MREAVAGWLVVAAVVGACGDDDNPATLDGPTDGAFCEWTAVIDPGGCPSGSPGPTGAAPVEQQLGDGFSVRRNLTFGTRGGRVLQGDLFLPPTTATRSGVLMVVHGGGWMDCERRRAATDWYAGVMSRLLGIAAFNIEYRLVQEGGAYPENLGDVKCAVQWLAANGAAHGVDGTRVVVVGESAGAHLALMTALTQSRGDLDPGCGPMPPRVAGAIAFSAPTDMPTLNGGTSLAAGAPAMYAGPCETPIGECDEGRSCDRCIDASPAAHACAETTRLVIVQAADPFDPLVPEAQARILGDALVAAGKQVDLVVVPEAQLRMEGCEPGVLDQRTPHGLVPGQTCLTTPSGPAVSTLLSSTIDPR